MIHSEIPRVACRTKAEWDTAYETWNSAGRPGGRLGRPVLDCLRDCERCGKTATTELSMLPAFHFDPEKWCTCAQPSTLPEKPSVPPPSSSEGPNS